MEIRIAQSIGHGDSNKLLNKEIGACLAPYSGINVAPAAFLSSRDGESLTPYRMHVSSDVLHPNPPIFIIGFFKGRSE